MKDAIRLVGVICVAVGILYMLRPDVPRRLMEFFKKGSRMYLVGVIRFALAVVFLVGADRCRHKWVIVGFGIVFLISGLLVFMLGAKRLRAMTDWFGKRPALLLRVLGVIALAVGAVICYSA